MQIDHTEIEPAASIVTIAGRIMLGAESAGIQTLVEELIKQGRRNLIFDLSGVTHIDSTGIGRFIDGFNRIHEIGGTLRMAASSGTVRDSFRVTRLDTIFPFYESVAKALEGLT